MITNQALSFLYDLGISDIQINIYKYLLIHKFGTINDIKSELSLSYTQVYHGLHQLEKKKLVDSSSDSKPKLYTRITPKIALHELVDKKFHNVKESIKKLDEELKIQETRFGRCLKDVSFYHYSDINLAIENFYDLIELAKKEIVITALPPSILKKLEYSLYNAFLKGIKIKMYFSLLDFEHFPHYFEVIINIFKRIRIEIIETEEKTCRVVRYNDEIVNMGNILIDQNYLNSILFKEDELFHIDGFTGGIFVEQAKRWLEILTVVKRIEIEYPQPIQNVVDVIKKFDSIKTRDISEKSRIGGARLREILEFLIRDGKIKETVTNEGVGRPAIYYRVV